MKHGIDLLRSFLIPYTVEAVIRPADQTAVVTVIHKEVKVTRVLKQADLKDRARLAEHVNDFKRDMAWMRNDAGLERIELMQRLGSRGLASFNPALHRPDKLK